MPPTFDAYAWVDARDQVAALSSFIDRYVDAEMPGDPRIYAFVRTFVSRDPDPGDAEALTELRQDDSAQASFSLYLRAKEHAGAIVTLTEEGAVVLGISLDDPENAPETAQTASALMASLIAEFDANCGGVGVGRTTSAADPVRVDGRRARRPTRRHRLTPSNAL
jgi:hypothetical protein